MNICDICKKNPASRTITRISGTTRSVKHLCNECASQDGGGFNFSSSAGSQPSQGYGGQAGQDGSSVSPGSPNDFGGIFGNDLFGDIFREFFGGSAGSPHARGERGVQERIDAGDYMSEAAKEVMSRSAEIAQGYKHTEIDSDHLMLALIETNVVQDIFSRLKIKDKDIRDYLKKNMVMGDMETRSLEFSPRIKRILDLSLAEAQRLRHNYIGPEHLLLALTKEEEGLGAHALKRLKVDYDALSRKVAAVVRKGSKEAFVPQMNTPTLDQFSRDLTQLAAAGKLDPVIGRTNEIESAVEILARRTKNNPVLIGEPGVGKTAIVEGLAQRIVTDNVPEALTGKRVVELDLAALLAGTQFRGQFEERVKKILEEITSNSDKLIVFVDELHLLVGAGTAQESAMDAANMFKPVLARGELHLVGATTLKEYQKHIEKDQALERRFQPIYVAEPSVGDTIEILRGLRDKYESHHRVRILDDALISAAELSHRYISGRFLPDKAIDLVDQAAARVRIQFTKEPDGIRELEAKIRSLEKEKEASKYAKDQKKVKSYDKEIEKSKEKLTGIVDEWETKKAKIMPEVTPESIAEVISKLTGIPVTDLTQSEKEKLMKLEERIKERLVGQDDAVRSVSDAIRRGRAGLSDAHRPIASFLLLGPTGVGKTELVRSLAFVLFGSDDAMIRLDMSEYMEKHNVSRLVGAPPGYVGYDEGGQLTEAVRRRPHSIILLDEIEKAHPDVFNMLLQVLEDGILTDGQGRKVNFANTIIIATSNIGSEMIYEDMDKPETDRMSYDALKTALTQKLRTVFRPEFINRIDEVVAFRALGKDELAKIVQLQIERVREKLQSAGFNLEVTKKAVDQIVEEGFDPHFGARELRRIIQKNVENAISQEVLKGDHERGSTISVDYAKDKGFKVQFRKQEVGKA